MRPRPAVAVGLFVAFIAGKADAGDPVGQRVAREAQMRAAAAGVLPDFVMVASDVGPVIDIGVPLGLIGRGRIGAGAVAVALIAEFGKVAWAAIRTGYEHLLMCLM